MAQVKWRGRRQEKQRERERLRDGLSPLYLTGTKSSLIRTAKKEGWMERRWRDKGRVRSENILEHPNTMRVCVRARVCVYPGTKGRDVTPHRVTAEYDICMHEILSVTGLYLVS